MTKRIVVVIASVLALGLGSSAEAQQERQLLPSDNNIAVANNGAKATVTEEMFKETEVDSPLDRIVSIRVANVPISAFLNSITAQAKINFIMSEEFANKKVTASLTRVTVREALDTLLRVHGLAYQRIGKSDSYVVTKRSNDAPDTITKIYTLSYISLHGTNGQDGKSSSSSNSGNTSTTSSNFGSGVTSGKDSYSDQSNITEIIGSMLSQVGKIATDPRTNKLIITDVPEVFPQIENILAELDIKPPQILIEAQIVEVNKTSGLNVGFTYGGTNGTILSVSAPRRALYGEFFHREGADGKRLHGWDWIFPRKAEIGDDNSGSGSGGSSSSSSSSEDSATSKAGLLDFGAFNIVLNALLTRGEAKYLGKPKVVTLNNKEAFITTSTDATIGTIVTDTGREGSTQTTTSAERKNVGLTLKVTPQVNREGYVTLFVQPSYSDLATSAMGDFSLDTVERSASTLVRVKNGQTVVIGGLLTSREVDNTRKVPLLGDIPILGWLFTSRSKRKDTTDLVIFITPTILAE